MQKDIEWAYDYLKDMGFKNRARRLFIAVEKLNAQINENKKEGD